MTAPARAFIPVARPLIGEEEKQAVMQVLESGQLAQGPKTQEFEEAFARYVGAKHAIGVNSGTARSSSRCRRTA
jgi:dTDP-4-amino-4,6-dideoxygalactose transaminase